MMTSYPDLYQRRHLPIGPEAEPQQPTHVDVTVPAGRAGADAAAPGPQPPDVAGRGRAAGADVAAATDTGGQRADVTGARRAGDLRPPRGTGLPGEEPLPRVHAAAPLACGQRADVTSDNAAASRTPAGNACAAWEPLGMRLCPRGLGWRLDRGGQRSGGGAWAKRAGPGRGGGVTLC